MIIFPGDQLLFTFADLKNLFLRHRSKIKTVAFIGGIVAFLVLVIQPPVYHHEATFKQSAKQHELNSNIKEMFQQFVASSSESAVIAVMQSKEVLRSVVEDLGMQADVNRSWFVFSGLRRIWENLCVEFGGTLPDSQRFVFGNVNYCGEKPLKMQVLLTENGSYELYNQDKELIGQGALGTQLSYPSGHLTLKSVPNNSKPNCFYPLVVHPWNGVVENLKKKFTITPLKVDKNILKLEFNDRDRILGAEILNRVMLGYQNYLKRENREICQEQYCYIQKREEELTKNFDHALGEHVAYLNENLSKSGFIGFTQEVEILSQPKTLYTSKLFNVDFELNRLRDGRPLVTIHDFKGVGSGESKQLHGNLEKCALDIHRCEANNCELAALESDEFSGLSLETAQGLLVEYTRQRDSLQAQMRELVFLKDQMGKSDFEMSSLSGVVNDDVTKDIAVKASAIALQLKDENNRSLREQERLNETLQTQKNFLSHYLLQTSDLKKLRVKLLSDKIASLQQQTFSLLETEKQLLQNKLQELNVRMSDLPEKWRRESLLLLKKELGAAMIEGVSQLAETKSLSQHIFQVSSRPLDKAWPPMTPKPPRMLLASFFAAILAGLGFYILLFCRSLLKGLPVSDQSLKMAGFPVSGKLSRFCNTHIAELKTQDLETLRSAASFLSSQKKGAETITAVCIGGHYPDYSQSLAELLAISGLRTLVIHCVFDQVVHPNEIPGLWQYLHGQEISLPIRRHLTYDFLPSGGTSRHGAEMLLSSKFQAVLTRARQDYDVVLIFSSADATTSEGHSLLKVADAAIITVQKETREQLAIYCDGAEQKAGHRTTFIYADEFG